MAWNTHKPPSGIPARGPGWGGEAKGYRGAPAFTVDQQPTAEAKVKGRRMAETARDVAKAHAEEMARVLHDIARDDTIPPQTRVDAANKLIDRAEGKPAQAIGGDPNGVPIKTVVTWQDDGA